MTKSSLRARFERLGPIQGVDRVEGGSPAVFSLRAAESLADIKTITATMALARRGLGLLRAKRTIEEVVETGGCVVLVPCVESRDAFAGEMAEHGIALRLVAARPADVRAIRAGLGLTQEQFAHRYGLDPSAVRNWEYGRRQPDRAAQSYLRVIERLPREISLAQEEDLPATGHKSR